MKPNNDEKKDLGPGAAMLTRYEAPAIEWEEPLVAVAQLSAACAKFPLTDPQCVVNPSAS